MTSTTGRPLVMSEGDAEVGRQKYQTDSDMYASGKELRQNTWVYVKSETSNSNFNGEYTYYTGEHTSSSSLGNKSDNSTTPGSATCDSKNSTTHWKKSITQSNSNNAKRRSPLSYVDLKNESIGERLNLPRLPGLL